MNKSMLLTAISLGSLVISFPIKAEDSKNTILIVDCKNDEQKKCVLDEFQSFDTKFSLCLTGRGTDSLSLDEFVDKKYPSKSPTDVIKQSKKDWIANVVKTCADSPIEEEKVDKATKVFTESSSWTNQFMVGYSINSAYEDDGTHKGLTEQAPLAQFSFDGRWLVDKKAPIHWEIGGFFASSPSFTGIENPPVTEETTDPAVDGEVETETDEGTEDSVDDSITVSKPTFNDVVGSLDVYTKLTTSFWNDDSGVLNDYFAVGGIAGFKTRDKVADDLDAVVYYYGPILEYRYYGKDMRTNKNSIPRGKVWAGYLRFEEYGGLDDQDRLLLVGEWQLNDNEEAEPDEGRFVVGLKANLGEGADDVGIYFAYRSGFDSIQSFLTGK